MIGWLIAEFWPFILAGLGVLSGVLGFKVAGIERAKRKDAERKADTHKELREIEGELSDLDDTSLADRITRK